MPSDRARISYDPARRYSGIVWQQGRVSMEEDANEAAFLAAETLRAETAEIVGVCGTPDNGYEVLPRPRELHFDFNVGAGTMYVDGLRVQTAATGYFEQTEWLDRSFDPLWVDPSRNVVAPPQELVYLLLREQEVTATEDRTLRDVALGGPDTTARKRLVQRIARRTIEAQSCEKALMEIDEWLSRRGLSLDANRRLTSGATLKVSFGDLPAAEDDCEPDAEPGYLGADNQLIRVQITAAEVNSGRFAWAMNNASFTYRAKGQGNTLIIEGEPLDAYHTPSMGKVVEVLAPAIDLTDDEWVAQHAGVFARVTAEYNPRSRSIEIGEDLPEALQKASTLFVRLWEDELEFEAGRPVRLGDTNLQATLDLHSTGGQLSVGQFWAFAVRPGAFDPDHPHGYVLPRRYLDAPQPPDGPRQWLCPLAVIDWPHNALRTLDCRNLFDDLVTMTAAKAVEGCCVIISPKDVPTPAAWARLLESVAGRPATICLQPGSYELTAPIRVGAANEGLTIEGCQDGAVFTTAPGIHGGLERGLVELVRADNVTLRRLRFHLPHAPFPGPRSTFRTMSIGVRVIHCAELHVEDCLFRFNLLDGVSTYGVGLYINSECWNLMVERSRFLHDDEFQRLDPQRFLVGIGVASAALAEPAIRGRPSRERRALALLENAVISHNEFSGLTNATIVSAEMGLARCDKNFVWGCDAGFYFVNADFSRKANVLRAALRARPAIAGTPQALGMALLSTQPELISRIELLTRSLRLPPDFRPRDATIVTQPSSQETRAARVEGTREFTALRRAMPAVAMPAVARPRPGDEVREAPTAPVFTLNTAAISALLQPVVPWHRTEVVTRHSPALRFSDNEVVLRDDEHSDDNPASLPGMAIWANFLKEDRASVMLTGNRLQSRPMFNADAVVLLDGPEQAVVTGNLILNQKPTVFGVPIFSHSLVLRAAEGNPLVSVIGNGFKAPALIQPARLVAPSPGWEFLNSTIPLV